MTRHYGDRMIPVALAVVSLGLVAACLAVWGLTAQVKQQQAAMNQLLAERVEDRQDAERLRSLVLALQQQVRDLGGQPLTAPPSPSTRRAQPAPTAGGPSARPPATATRSPTPTSPSPRPSASPRPTVSPTPTSSPSPLVCVGPICYPPGGTT